MYVVYRIDSEEPFSRGAEMVVEEELHLIQEGDLTAAIERSLSVGLRVADFGRRWLGGDPDVPKRIGLEDVDPALRLAPSLVNTYKACRFLGLKDVLLLKEEPRHGMEIDSRPLNFKKSEIAGMVAAKDALGAFTPVRGSGPRGTVYGAEQLFWISTKKGLELRGPKGGLQRIVLIEAQNARQAYDAACCDGHEWASNNRGFSFLGLGELRDAGQRIEDWMEIWSIILEGVGEEYRLKYPHE